MKSSENKYRKLAQEILTAIGGAKNISRVNHCSTRLRFILKNNDVPQDKTVKQIDGVIEVVRAGGAISNNCWSKSN